MLDPATEVDDRMREEAKRNPNGWVYVIAGSYGPSEAVPPEAIVGAWRVDGAGAIVGGSFVHTRDTKAGCHVAPEGLPRAGKIYGRY